MRKLLLHLPDELHEDLKDLAHQKKKSMGELIRQAIEQTYEDELDALLMDRELAAHAGDPLSSISLEQYLTSQHIALPR